jgi:DNA-binding transcriptional LysR family regulator
MVHPTVLTPEGRALLPHAVEILSHFGLLADLSVADGVVRGRGLIHPLVTAGELEHELLWQEPLVSVFHEAHPPPPASSIRAVPPPTLPVAPA